MVRRKGRDVPRPFDMPWGKGEIVEEATATGEWHEPAIQLLRYEDGSYAVRFAHYDHSGRFQRSPLMISADTIAGLRRALKDTPKLRKLLQGILDSGVPTRTRGGRGRAPAKTSSKRIGAKRR